MKKNTTEEKQNLINITQWVVPTAVLFVYVLVTLYSFSTNMRKDAAYNVRQKVSEYNDAITSEFNSKITVAEAVAKATGDIVAREISHFKEEPDLKEIAGDVLDITVAEAGARSASMVDQSGRGYTNKGDYVELKDTSLINRCLVEGGAAVSEVFQEDGVWYVDIYEPAGSFAGSKYAVIYQYGVDVFERIPSATKYDGRTAYALLSTDGTVVSVGGKGFLNRGDNIFEDETLNLDENIKVRMRNNFKNRNSGYSECSIGSDERLMIYDPVSYGGMLAAVYVTKAYMTNEAEASYSALQSIVIRVVIAMIAFFVAILVINLANKAVNTKHNQTLQEKAETDLLTGLLNKLSTEQKITDYLAEAKNRGEGALLFLIDVDNFKKVNDTMGHAFGDELLAGLGLGLSTLYRATDIVGRIGGDEFLVLMKNVPTDEETKKREAEKLLNFFRSFKVGEYVQYKCTASIGGAVFDADGSDFTELYKSADQAMYESKRHGKNRLCYHGEVLEGPVIDISRHD